jgi:hypothetical protein
MLVLICFACIYVPTHDPRFLPHDPIADVSEQCRVALSCTWPWPVIPSPPVKAWPLDRNTALVIGRRVWLVKVDPFGQQHVTILKDERPEF